MRTDIKDILAEGSARSTWTNTRRAVIPIRVAR